MHRWLEEVTSSQRVFMVAHPLKHILMKAIFFGHAGWWKLIKELWTTSWAKMWYCVCKSFHIDRIPQTSAAGTHEQNSSIGTDTDLLKYAVHTHHSLFGILVHIACMRWGIIYVRMRTFSRFADELYTSYTWLINRFSVLVSRLFCTYLWNYHQKFPIIYRCDSLQFPAIAYYVWNMLFFNFIFFSLKLPSEHVAWAHVQVLVLQSKLKEETNFLCSKRELEDPRMGWWGVWGLCMLLVVDDRVSGEMYWSILCTFLVTTIFSMMEDVKHNKSMRSIIVAVFFDFWLNLETHSIPGNQSWFFDTEVFSVSETFPSFWRLKNMYR